MFFFFFNDTATTEIYPLSLHDALPISTLASALAGFGGACMSRSRLPVAHEGSNWSPSAWSRSLSSRSEEHTSELQSRPHLVCRLLLEKKKTRLTSVHPIRALRKHHELN